MVRSFEPTLKVECQNGALVELLENVFQYQGETMARSAYLFPSVSFCADSVFGIERRLKFMCRLGLSRTFNRHRHKVQVVRMPLG